MTILESIRHWSRIAPQHSALISGGNVLTYLELQQNSETLAEYLAASLPDDHSPVAVVGHKEPEMLTGFLAAVKSGHPYIPIDTSTPPQRIETILEKSGVAMRLTPGSIKELLISLPPSKPERPAREINPQDPWYIIFTSGSTGDPKGVIITAACLESFVAWMLGEQHLAEQNEVFINQAPFSFDLSVMDLYLSLGTGGTLNCITKDEISEPRQLFISLASSNATVWVSTPSFAQMCLNEPTFSQGMLPRLHKFLFCGETLPPEVAAGLFERFPQAEVWNTYGPTEATCATTSLQITKNIIADYSPLPVGCPKPDCRIVVAKGDANLCEENERGEIIIAGPNVSPGYLGQPDLTQKAFFEFEGQHAYHTGDLGHFQGDMLFFDGRLDSQIKLHGYRIEPGDIEANLLALPSIRDAVVLPHLKDGQPDFLTAFVIFKNKPVQSDFETARNLKRELKQRLPAYMLPHKFWFLDGFPMTANGKVEPAQAG